MKISLIIPTLNAATRMNRLILMLMKQTVVPDEIIVVDSQSEDDTVRIVSEMPNVRLIQIERNSFDHGGTRDSALRQSCGDVVVFMTQDALPTDEHFIERLMAPLKDENVAAVGGRQTAYPDARPYERLVRAYNYPQEDRVWSAEDIAHLGIRAFLISDVCAAYRREAYLSVGGFDHPILTNEDVLMAERLLHAGYKLAYAGQASVYHSHSFTLRQEYRRNKIIGQTMKRYEERFEYVQEMGTGKAVAKHVLLALLREGRLLESLCFCANCAARLAGNRIGRCVELRIEKRKNHCVINKEEL